MKSALGRPRRAGVGRSLRRATASAPTSRCASTRRACSAAIRKLVLHGGGNTSVKTAMPDLLGEATEVLCVKGSGADMADDRAAGLAGGAARPPAQAARARDALTDEDMVRVQRANLLDPAAPNPSVETLLHAFLPHKFVDHTHSTAVLSLVDQPDGEAICAEVYDGRVGIVPYIMPGFALAQGGRRRLRASARRRRADPAQARHLHLRRRRAREAYERMIELVTLAEDAARAQSQGGVRHRATAAARSRRSPRSRRSLRGACSLQGREDRGRLAPPHPRFPRDAGGARFRQRRRGRALQPGRRGHARPHHPHQELAAARARPRRRQARRLQPRRARGGRRLHRELPGLFRAQQRARRRHQDACSIRCRASCWCRASACSASAARKKDARVAADLAECRDRDHHRRRGDRPLRVDLRSRHVRHGILVARTGEARRAPRKPLAGQIAAITGAGGTIGAATAQGVRRRRRRGRAARHRRGRRGREGQGDRRRGARGRAAT